MEFSLPLLSSRCWQEDRRIRRQRRWRRKRRVTSMAVFGEWVTTRLRVWPRGWVAQAVGRTKVTGDKGVRDFKIKMENVLSTEILSYLWWWQYYPVNAGRWGRWCCQWGETQSRVTVQKRWWEVERCWPPSSLSCHRWTTGLSQHLSRDRQGRPCPQPDFS